MRTGLTRRQFLRTAAAIGGGALLLGGSGDRVQWAARNGGAGTTIRLREWDEEFNELLGDEWQDLGSGSGTYDVNRHVPGALYMEGSRSGATYVGLYKPTPPPPFVVTAKIARVVNDASDFSDCGLMLGEATPGAFIHGCWDVAIVGRFTIIGSYWSSPENWVMNIGTAFDIGTTPLPHYSRFVVHPQNAVDGYFSLDGDSWTQWLEGYRPPFKIGSVGLDLHDLTNHTSTTVDWLRFSSPNATS